MIWLKKIHLLNLIRNKNLLIANVIFWSSQTKWRLFLSHYVTVEWIEDKVLENSRLSVTVSRINWRCSALNELSDECCEFLTNFLLLFWFFYCRYGSKSEILKLLFNDMLPKPGCIIIVVLSLNIPFNWLFWKLANFINWRFWNFCRDW